MLGFFELLKPPFALLIFQFHIHLFTLFLPVQLLLLVVIFNPLHCCVTGLESGNLPLTQGFGILG